jgi:tetratricopeptide (TPR) repeat protein
VALRTGERLLTAEDLSVEATTRWVQAYARAFPDATQELIDLLERLQRENPGRAAPVLATAAIAATGERASLLDTAVARARDYPADLAPTLAQAAALIAPEDPSTAIAWYRETAALLPADPSPLLGAAAVQIGARDFGSALDTIQDAVARAPADLDARRMLGDVQAELLMFREAADSWQFVAQRAPRDANVRLRLAQLMERQGRLAEARRYYESAASIQPSLRAELQRFLERAQQP